MTLVTGVLVPGVCAVPSGVVLGLALAAPNDGPRWVAFFVALALAMIGGAFGPDRVEACRFPGGSDRGGSSRLPVPVERQFGGTPSLDRGGARPITTL
ncbi:hypothetical protein [Kitasatospora cineracea]|uniref:hypothetical protein n=1 Tax=Kitasatospora cineracea TaxID=88074 RepID=UPI000F5095FC|nr:hypothetical protein [Kitasatospora cineracea]